MERDKRSTSRREFVKRSLLGATFLVSSSGLSRSEAQGRTPRLWLGGPVFEKYADPDGWVKTVKTLGYSAAYCPVGASANDGVVKAYAGAAERANIIIAEVGVWSNPISPNEKERQAALEKCRTQLALADRIGARCCVNIAGSRGELWNGPSPENLTDETFDMIVETTRSIIDDVKPIRTYFTLETMPWAYPDSPDS